jgi:hypothetical protein
MVEVAGALLLCQEAPETYQRNDKRWAYRRQSGHERV